MNEKRYFVPASELYDEPHPEWRTVEVVHISDLNGEFDAQDRSLDPEDPLEGANCGLCGATADNFHVPDDLWERVGLGHVQACFKCFRIAAWHAGVRNGGNPWEVCLRRIPDCERRTTMRKLRRKLDLIYLRPVVESATNPEYLREVALSLLAEVEHLRGRYAEAWRRWFVEAESDA